MPVRRRTYTDEVRKRKVAEEERDWWKGTAVTNAAAADTVRAAMASTVQAILLIHQVSTDGTTCLEDGLPHPCPTGRALPDMSAYALEA